MTKRVLVNGLKSRTGGGRSILHNYLRLLRGWEGSERYYVVTPDPTEYQAYATSRVHLVHPGRLYNHNLASPVLYGYAFPRILGRLGIDVVLNFGDIPLATHLPQILLFDWPYAVYPGNPAWRRMGLRSRGLRTVKLMIFRTFLRYVDLVVAQTETARERLHRLYGLDRVVVIPNAVSIEDISHSEEHPFPLPEDRKKLLYLTRWYPHKNVEALLPLARRIRARGLGLAIITTLDRREHRSAARFLAQTEREGLDDIIVNIGTVPRRLVGAVYRSCDALLMPTLLESFSGCYVEAMHHGLPVLTSDRDFAREVCGDAARYFDPLSVDSILETVEKTFSCERETADRVEAGTKRVAAMPGWPRVFDMFQRLIVEEWYRDRGPLRDEAS